MKIKRIIICCLVMLAMPAMASDLEAYVNQGTNAKVLFVLDASGSMLLTETGAITGNYDESRMKTLSDALENVIDELGETSNLQFGLTWFGGLTASGIKLPMRSLASPASDLYNINYGEDFTGTEINFGELFLNTVQNIYPEDEYDPSGYDVLEAGLYDKKPLVDTGFNVSLVPNCGTKTVDDLIAEANWFSPTGGPGGFADDTSTTGGILAGATDRPWIWENSGAGATPWPMSDPASGSDLVPATWIQNCPAIPAVCDKNPIIPVGSGNWWDPDQCRIDIGGGLETAVDRFAGEWPACASGQAVQVHGCVSTYFSLLNETQSMQTPTVDALFEAARYFRGEKVFFGTRDHFPTFNEDVGRYFDEVEAITYTWPGYTGPEISPETYNKPGVPANTELYDARDRIAFANNGNDYVFRHSGPIAALGWRSVNRAALTAETRDSIRKYIPTEFWATASSGLLHNVFNHTFSYDVAESRWNLFLSSIYRKNIVESPYTDFDDFMATTPSLAELWQVDRYGDVTAGGVTYGSIKDDPHFECEEPAIDGEYCDANFSCPTENPPAGCKDLRYLEFYPASDPGFEPYPHAGFLPGDVWCESEAVGGTWVEVSTITRTCEMRFESTGVYDSPVDECSNQAIILISDGYPTGNFIDNGDQNVDPNASFADYVFADYNFDTPGLIRRMIHNNTDEHWVANDHIHRFCSSLFDGAVFGSTEWITNNAGGCGTELTGFLANHQQVEGKALSTVSTHAIGFNIDGVGQTFLQKLTESGKGIYASANNEDELVEAIEDMISLAQTPTADTPALTINLDNSSLQTQNIVFAPVFKASGKPVWAANVKAYFLNPEVDDEGKEIGITLPYVNGGLRSFWSNEDTLVIPEDVDDPARFTTLHGGLNSYLFHPNKDLFPREIYLEREVWNGTGAFDKFYKVGHPGHSPDAAYLGIEDPTASNSENQDAADELMEWYAQQPLADSLHSKPTLVTYDGDHTFPDGSSVSDPKILYVVSNRGLLHAFDVTDLGKDVDDSGASFTLSSNAPVEIGAWMPHSLATKITEQHTAEYGDDHIYGLDGEIRVFREPANAEATSFNTYLLLGMRRGGNSYYKIDISDPGEFDVDWRVDTSTTGFEDLGQTWSPMAVMKLKWPGDTDKFVGVVGGGYDEIDDLRGTSRSETIGAAGAALYLIDMDDGSLIASVGGASSGATYTNENMKWGIPSEIRVIDSTGDGYADRLYYGDMGGQLWRTDVNSDGEVSTVTLTNNVILDVGGDTPTSHRRIYEPPAVSYLPSGEIAVVVTTGYRAHPLNGATIDPATDELYPVIEDGVFMVKDLGTYPLGLVDLVNVTDESVELASDAPGWRLVLKETVSGGEEGTGYIGEKVLSEPVIFNGRLLFTTTIPDEGADVCSVSATQNRFYSINLFNAGASGDLRNKVTTVTDPGDSEAPDEVDSIGDPVRFITLNSTNAIESELALSADSEAMGCKDGMACGNFYVGTQAVGKYELAPGKVYWKETGVIENDQRFE